MSLKKNDPHDPRLEYPQCGLLTPVEKVHENPWFSVFNRGGYFTIEYTQRQVLILAVVANKSVVMVRVKRPVIADITLEIPAGGINPHETPNEAASREFREETGIGISPIDRFKVLPPLVHMVRGPVIPYIFEVNLTQEEFDKKGSHDNEVTKVCLFSFEQIKQMIVDGDIYVGLQIAILARFFMEYHVQSYPHFLSKNSV